MSGKSESEKERKCKRSACWHFYDKTPGGGFCRICQKEILTQAGGTTNLRNHLRRRHGELWVATMENRLDPSTLTISDRRSESLAEGIPVTEIDPADTASETNTAVHTIQAYRDANGTTFLYLHPTTEGEGNAQFQPVVASSETITTNGEIVSVAAQKDTHEGQAVDGDAKTQEEATPRRLIPTPVKNYQGSSVAGKAVVRQLTRPSPIRTNSNNNNNNSNKEDSYEAFGKYIASMLRTLPSKSACKLQGEIVNWILKEQMKNNNS